MAWTAKPRHVTLLLLAAGLLALMVGGFVFRSRTQAFGVTFSAQYATALGLDWRAAYGAVLTELDPLIVRITMPWDSIEPAQGQINLADYDWMMSEAEKHGTQIVLAIGAKVPRWPECQSPDWAEVLDDADYTTALLNVEQHIVLAYRDHPALVRWQVENEPLFAFGECPPPNIDRLRAEVDLVRSLDSGHPIVLTSSGEQANWLELSSLADVVGVSMYRFAWSTLVGPVVFPHNPLYYRAQAAIVSLISGDPVVISELQMEPWFADGANNESGASVSFSVNDFDEHVRFARETGIAEVWLWGVEWWYREREEGRPEMWNAAKTLFAE